MKKRDKTPLWLTGIQVAVLVIVFSLFYLGTDGTPIFGLREWAVGFLAGVLVLVVSLTFGVVSVVSRYRATQKASAAQATP